MHRNRPPAAFRIVVVTLALVGGSAVVAQDKDPLANVRTQNPVTAVGQTAITAWIAANLQAWDVAADKVAADGAFRKAVAAEIGHANASEEYKVNLAAQVAAVFEPQFASKEQLDKALARTFAAALVEIARPNTLAALEAGLSFPDEQTRYDCARAFLRMQTAIAADQQLTLRTLSLLQEAAKEETSPVVLSRLYAAMAYGDRDTAPAVKAMIAVFNARVTRWRQGIYIGDRAEVPAFDFLLDKGNATKVDQADRHTLVGLVATMLRLDMTRYLDGNPRGQEKEAIEYRVPFEERLLALLVAPPALPNIAEVMQKGGPNAAKDMLDRLHLWIGTAAASGILNAAPWNVPIGSP